MNTGLKDKNGKEIMSGDMVSLAGNITADDTMGVEPNGFIFTDEDIYKVFWDSTINNWSLIIDGVDMGDNADIKFLNHAVCLLHEGNCEVKL